MPSKAVRRELVHAVEVEVGAERRERVDVRVQSPPADDVTAGRRHGHAAEAREQRAGEQERSADLAAELRIEIRLADATRVDADLVPIRPLDVGSDVLQQLDHRLDVADAGHVREPHLT